MKPVTGSSFLTCAFRLYFPPLKLSRKVDITNTSGPIQVKYSYSIEWYKESLEWQHRHSRYEGKLHWLSITSSFVVVLLVTALLSIFMLRILKKDVARYLDLDNEALEGEEVRFHHCGWENSVMPKYNTNDDACDISPALLDWLEIDPRRCIPFSQSFNIVLCRGGYWKSFVRIDILPLILGHIWYNLNTTTWIHFGGCCRIVLLNIICRWLYLCTIVSTNEWKRLDTMLVANDGIIPITSILCIYVGEYNCHTARVNQCFTN